MTPQISVYCIGLGAMGWGIAANVCKRGLSSKLVSRVYVWNRTQAKAQQHSFDFGTESVRNLTDVNEIDIIITCLPTSTEVADIADQLVSLLKSGAIWIDCTSGDPHKSREIGQKLGQCNICFADCAVSGGPCGAISGELSAMVGSNNFDCVLPFISLFARKKIVHCGDVGAGHAVKAINNTLNAAHLILGAEALIALKNFDIDPDKALQAINASSGRSLQTEVRIPKEVLTRNFNYGFKLGLMAKDIQTASESLNIPPNFMLYSTHIFLTRALSEHGSDADYTELVKTLESEANVQLNLAQSSIIQSANKN